MPLKDISNQAKVNAKVHFPSAAGQVLGKVTAPSCKPALGKATCKLEEGEQLFLVPSSYVLTFCTPEPLLHISW